MRNRLIALAPLALFPLIAQAQDTTPPQIQVKPCEATIAAADKDVPAVWRVEVKTTNDAGTFGQGPLCVQDAFGSWVRVTACTAMIPCAPVTFRVDETVAQGESVVLVIP